MFHRYCFIACLTSMLLVATASSLALAQQVAEKSVASEKPTEQKKATEKKPNNQYLRIAKDENGELKALETAIIRLVPEEAGRDLKIDLIGAIHIAEPEYYDQLNQEFDKYDAVLYELVAPKDTRPEQGDENRNTGLVGTMQHGMSDMLELEHQLDGIDYKRDQFVHADLSPDEFVESMRERKESIFGYAVRLFAASTVQQSMQQDSGANDMAVLAAMLSPNRASALKRVMAPQFVNMEITMFLVDGPKGSTLISARNQKAVDVLQEKIREGKKKIAIFYGAGHLPDLERRIVKELKLQRGKTRWLQAWDLKKKAPKKAEDPKATKEKQDPA